MTAKIIQFVPKPNPNRETLEQQAAGLVGFLNGLTAVDASQAETGYAAQKLTYETIPNIGQGIDGMAFEKDGVRD